jgi:hypothetical protein
MASRGSHVCPRVALKVAGSGRGLKKNVLLDLFFVVQLDAGWLAWSRDCVR